MVNDTGAGPMSWLDLSNPPKPATRVRDGRICACGHAAGAHAPLDTADFRKDIAEAEGGIVCKPGKQNCRCGKFEAMLVTSDTRRFMGKTTGPDGEHALARGVVSALNAGKTVNWLQAATLCGKCSAVTEKLTPVAVRFRQDAPAVAARESTTHNYLLCEKCRAELETEPELTALADVSGFSFGSK